MLHSHFGSEMSYFKWLKICNLFYLLDIVKNNEGHLHMKSFELRRYKDIIAVKNPQGSITGFHASNMEVAELSEDIFSLMAPISVLESQIPETFTELAEKSLDTALLLKEWNEEVNPHAETLKLEFGIKTITLNVNQICNLKCVYCAAGGDGTYGSAINKVEIEKTLPQLRFFAEKLNKEHTLKINIIGGEPLLYPEAIKAIHDYLAALSAELNIRTQVALITNGTLLKGKVLELIRTLKIHLTFSFDGEPEVNDISRPTKNNTSSTELILEALQELNENKGNILSWGISCVFTQHHKSLLKTYQFFKTLSPDWIDFQYDVGLFEEQLQQNYLQGLREIAEVAFLAEGEAGLRQIRNFDGLITNLDRQLRIENHCGAGKSFLMIDAKNQLYTCPWDVGQKHEQVGENKQLDHDKLANYSESLIKLNNCSTCWARHLCGGGCMFINKSKNFDKHKKDTLFCERIRSLILILLPYYKQLRTAQT